MKLEKRDFKMGTNSEEITERVKQNFDLLEDELSQMVYSAQVYYNITGDYEYIAKLLRALYCDYKDFVKSDMLKKVLDDNKSDILRGVPVKTFRVDMDNMFFEPGIIKLTDDEAFIDGGSKDLGTALEFAFAVHDKFKSICAFEPDPVCFEMCKDNLVFIPKEKRDDVHLFDFGLSDYDGTANFERSYEAGLSKIVEESKENIRVKKLDDVSEAEDATFIKMHVEGSELAALKGAEKIIKANKPKIAVSLYHNLNQLLDVPAYLKSLVPEYKLYMRHYSSGTSESVLYAVL